MKWQSFKLLGKSCFVLFVRIRREQNRKMRVFLNPEIVWTFSPWWWWQPGSGFDLSKGDFASSLIGIFPRFHQATTVSLESSAVHLHPDFQYPSSFVARPPIFLHGHLAARKMPAFLIVYSLLVLIKLCNLKTFSARKRRTRISHASPPFPSKKDFSASPFAVL